VIGEGENAVGTGWDVHIQENALRLPALRRRPITGDPQSEPFWSWEGGGVPKGIQIFKYLQFTRIVNMKNI
jgi:hypothetical protein